jgi:hypothetical protein
METPTPFRLVFTASSACWTFGGSTLNLIVNVRVCAMFDYGLSIALGIVAVAFIGLILYAATGFSFFFIAAALWAFWYSLRSAHS